MRGRKDNHDLEKRLRGERPRPSREFLNETIRMLSGRRRTAVGRIVSIRFAVAGVLLAVGLAAFAGFGGFGYAGAAAHSLVSSVKSGGSTTSTTTNASSTTTNGTGTSGTGTGTNSAGVAPAKPSSADDEYPQKTTICHRTGSQTHPFVIITVPNTALATHKAHGDTLVGPGNTCPGPPIP
jgi:hypothetical protein